MQSRRSAQTLIAVGSLFAALAVAAGAFGAHMLKSILDPPMLAVFETAAGTVERLTPCPCHTPAELVIERLRRGCNTKLYFTLLETVRAFFAEPS